MESFLSRQPVAWRNLKASVFDPDRYLFKIQRFLGIVLLLFLGIGTIAFKPPRAGDFVVFTVLTVIVIHFLLAVLTAGSVSRERERGSLDLLRMTMLTPNQIVVGNAVGAFRAVRFSLWVLFALLVYAVLFQVFTFTFTVAYTAILAVGMLCIASQAMLVSTAAPNTIAAMAAAVAVGFIWWLAPVCLEDNDSRGVSLGLAAAFFPLAFLPMARKPKIVQWISAGLASLVVLVLLSWSRIESSWVALIILAVIACLSINWLRSPFVLARLVAAGVCCITVPLSIGLLACSLYNVELRSVDQVLIYARYVVDVDRTQFGNDGYLRRVGSTRWGWSESNWAALAFFCTTLISTGLIHLITLKAFPKLTQPS